MHTLVMGIVNVTPDSFSDGGVYFKPEQVVARARNMIEEGADIIDLGGESTRPGAEPLPWEAEWARLEPVVAALAKEALPRRRAVPVSIDTYHPETALRALDAGASIINCVSEASVPAMVEICADKGAELVVPAKALNGETEFSRLPGFYIDPMIGFGTTREEDLRLLRSVGELAKLGRVLVGASRKRIVKKLTGEKTTGKNLGGNLGIAVWCALKGASVVRVHDVKETVQALRVVSALNG